MMKLHEDDDNRAQVPSSTGDATVKSNLCETTPLQYLCLLRALLDREIFSEYITCTTVKMPCGLVHLFTVLQHRHGIVSPVLVSLIISSHIPLASPLSSIDPMYSLTLIAYVD